MWKYHQTPCWSPDPEIVKRLVSCSDFEWSMLWDFPIRFEWVAPFHSQSLPGSSVARGGRQPTSAESWCSSCRWGHWVKGLLSTRTAGDLFTGQLNSPDCVFVFIGERDAWWCHLERTLICNPLWAEDKMSSVGNAFLHWWCFMGWWLHLQEVGPWWRKGIPEAMPWCTRVPTAVCSLLPEWECKPLSQASSLPFLLTQLLCHVVLCTYGTLIQMCLLSFNLLLLGHYSTATQKCPKTRSP